MQPGNLLFFMMLFGTEFFIAMMFYFLFPPDTFYQLLTFSGVMTLTLGLIGLLKARKEPTYNYRDMWGEGTE